MSRPFRVPAALAAVLAAAVAVGLAGLPGSASVSSSRTSTVESHFGLGPREGLHLKDVERDPDGTVHLRYTRTLGGLRVLGGDFVVHEAPTGRIEGADFATAQPLTLRTDVATAVGAADARSLATTTTVAPIGSRATSASKIVWAATGVPRLAWLTHVVRLDRGVQVPTAVVIDAQTGRTIQTWSLDQGVRGTGHALYAGTVPLQTKPIKHGFAMVDQTRGYSRVVDLHNRLDPHTGFLKGTLVTNRTNTWGNGRTSDRKTVAVDADYDVAQAWDFYRQTFHRKGISGNGRGVKVRVHYGDGYQRAFWNDGCYCITFGDGGGLLKPPVSLDIAGHELTHGVTSRTAGLFSFGDAGGLNESTSDIMGTSIECFAHNRSDPCDYYIGEKVVKPGRQSYLRRMDNPRLDGVSFDCWSATMGRNDPHAASGVGNHFFYLLAEGSGAATIGGLRHSSPTCAGAAPVQGIGRAKADQIWYRALTRYFVSTTGYVDGRDDTIHAAVDLYGKDSSECRQVVKAWNAVDVPGQYWTCSGPLRTGPNLFGPSPGFEPDNSAWGTPTGQAFITKDASLGLPRSGRWFGLLNSTSAASNGTISRTVTIPNSSTAMLRFYMLISVSTKADAHGGLVATDRGTVDIHINGTPLPASDGHWDQSFANDTYQRWDVPVDAWAGQTVVLSILGHQDAPTAPDGFFEVLLDDFSLTRR